jgi:hypothetical protein
LAADLARLVGLKSLQKTLSFHVPSEGEAPYDQRDISIHRSIVRLGKVVAVLGVFGAVAFFVLALVVTTGSSDRPGGSIVRLILFSIVVTAAIPVLAYFVGTSLGLLLAPSRFFKGPIGRKWLKVAGAKNAGVVRALCLAVLVALLAIIAVIAFIILSASNQA